MSQKRCPRCFSKLLEEEWTDDPIKTPKGEAGEDYIGCIYFNPIHITELQEIRSQQEIDVGIPEEDRTIFSEVVIENGIVDFWKKHLRELRESTEKILVATGQTKDNYFNYDEEGTEYNIGNHQTDWHDPDLTQKFIYIKAVHIEDLRHYLLSKIPMLLVNRQSGGDSSYFNQLIPACYSVSVYQRWGNYDCWVVHVNVFQDEDSCEVRVPYTDPDLTIQEGIECGGIDPPGYVYWGGIYYPWWKQFVGSEGSKTRHGINCLESYSSYANYDMNIAVYPDKESNVSQYEGYELQEFNIVPILVNETYGFPCVIDRVTLQKYAQPKVKSSGFLEDAISLGQKQTLNKLPCGGGWDSYFRKTDFPLTQASGISEEGFHERLINNEAIFLYPPMPVCALNQLGGQDYLESISFQGTNTTGNFSILVPTDWNLLAIDTLAERTSKLLYYKKTKELTRTLKRNSDLKFNINITQEVMDTAYEPAISLPIDVKFGGNYLLAKENGAFVAEEKYTNTTPVAKTASTISLNPQTISISVSLTVEGILYTRVDYADLGNYDNTEYIFAVDSNKIYFSGGALGNRIPNNIGSANIIYYCKEIPIKAYYPSGYIALDLTEEQQDAYEGITCYIVINYYNVASSYNEIKDPFIAYNMDKFNPYRTYSYTEYEYTNPSGTHGNINCPDAQGILPPATALTPTAIAGEEFL